MVAAREADRNSLPQRCRFGVAARLVALLCAASCSESCSGPSTGRSPARWEMKQSGHPAVRFGNAVTLPCFFFPLFPTEPMEASK